MNGFIVQVFGGPQVVGFFRQAENARQAVIDALFDELEVPEVFPGSVAVIVVQPMSVHAEIAEEGDDA